MGAQYEIEYGHGGTVTLHEKSVAYEGYVSFQGPGFQAEAYNNYNGNGWSFSGKWGAQIPEDITVGARGVKAKIGLSEQGTDLVFSGATVDFADAVGAKPLDFQLTIDEYGRATNLKVGLSASANGFSAAVGYSIEPHNVNDASQLRAITYDPNGNVMVTQYHISSRKKAYAITQIFGPTGQLLEEVKSPVSPETAAMISSGFLTPGEVPPECFLSGTPIDIWPEGLLTTPSVGSDASGLFDEELILSQITSKPIEDVSLDDVVVSYDADGRLQPGRVSRLYRNRVRHVLDVFGLKVTPGHVTFCGDGEFEGRHVPILDILRSDGSLVRADGSKVRAATGCDLGSEGDRLVMSIVGDRQPNGQIKIYETGELRAGTRVVLENGQDVSVLDLIEANDGDLTEDGYVRTSSDGQKLPFRWTFTPSLPKPEDYVLQRSGVTLPEIYDADEWEQIGPRTPAPEHLSKEETVQNAGHPKHLI